MLGIEIVTWLTMSAVESMVAQSVLGNERLVEKQGSGGVRQLYSYSDGTRLLIESQVEMFKFHA